MPYRTLSAVTEEPFELEAGSLSMKTGQFLQFNNKQKMSIKDQIITSNCKNRENQVEETKDEHLSFSSLSEEEAEEDCQDQFFLQPMKEVQQLQDAYLMPCTSSQEREQGSTTISTKSLKGSHSTAKSSGSLSR